MDKSEKGQADDDKDTRPRRPRRLRKEESNADEDDTAGSKSTAPAADAPQSKPRRKRTTNIDEETTGDGGWMGGIAQEQKPKFEPEPEAAVIVAYVWFHSFTNKFSDKIKTNILMKTLPVIALYLLHNSFKKLLSLTWMRMVEVMQINEVIFSNRRN